MKISITTVRTFIFLFFFTLASTLVSHAATFTVDDLSDGTANASHCEADSPPAGGDCSLRDAVAAANAAADSDTINFSVTGTITLSEGEIAISEDLAITGPGADMLTVDADGNSRIFLVDDSTVAKKVVSLTGLMFINGDSYNGGAILNYEELSVDSCVFEGNSATFSGGAIYNDEDGTITEITSSTFDGNSADRRYGGAIYNFYGIINISFSTIANNSASSSTGGGIFENFGSINIRNSIVAFNGPDNCDKDIAKEAADETNNYSDDDTCGFGTGDNSTILLGDLADNGGPTETLALLGGDPVDGASAGCDAINDPGVPLPNDQRGFTRPGGSLCDSGAYERVLIANTDIFTSPGQLNAYYDLGNGGSDGSPAARDTGYRKSYVQITNTYDAPVTIHVQIFQHDRDCSELDFFDELTVSDTVVYDMGNIVKNNGSKVSASLGEDSYGYVVVTPLDPQASIIGNFRIIDSSGYEYRTNMQNTGAATGNFAPGISYIINYNGANGARQADIVGFGYSIDGTGTVKNLSDNVVFDTYLFDLDEEPLSCDRVGFACGGVMNYGISEDYPSSRGEDLLCRGGGSSNPDGGVVSLENGVYTGNSSERVVFSGYAGINNGDGTGSMDSWILKK